MGFGPCQCSRAFFWRCNNLRLGDALSHKLEVEAAFPASCYTSAIEHRLIVGLYPMCRLVLRSKELVQVICRQHPQAGNIIMHLC